MIKKGVDISNLLSRRIDVNQQQTIKQIVIVAFKAIELRREIELLKRTYPTDS